MPTYYSREYRIKISRAFLRHRNARSVAKTYGVSVATVYRAAHEFTAYKFQPGGSKSYRHDRLIKAVGYHVSARIISEVLGVNIKTVWLARKRLGMTKRRK